MQRMVSGILLSLLCVVGLFGCGKPAPSEEGGGARLNVVVSILPQAAFVERVGGEHVKVDVLIGPGQSPHSYTPTAAEISRVAECDVYFTIGVPFEEAVKRRIAANRPDLPIINSREGVALRQMKEGHHHEEHASEQEHAHDHAHEQPHEGDHADDPDHEHGHEHDHAMGEPDPHVWLSPQNAKIISRNICDGLKRLDPQVATAYEANLAAFAEELDAVDREIRESLAPLEPREFMVFHPAFGYFADAYELEQLPVEIEGKDPSAKALNELIETAKEKGIRVVFVQPQFSSRRAEAVAEAINGAVVPMDPLARNYIENLRDMAQKIRSAIAPAPAETP